MEKGYIIFNADGSKPKTTLAVLEGDDGVQTILNMKSADVPMLFGCIVTALVNDAGINKDLLHHIVDDAPKHGEGWAAYCDVMRRLSGKIVDELGKIGNFEDFKEKLGEFLGINTENEDDE